MKRRGLLIIDRGSREQEAKDELEEITKRVKEKGKYNYCNYCFLEVIPPFIEEGIRKALKEQLDELTIVPYFLYLGKKIKVAVTDVMKFQSSTSTKFLVTKSMSMHKTMIDLVDNRITSTLKKNNRIESKKEIDVLIIGHGSKDPNAKIAIDYVVDGLKPTYKNVNRCFLEIEEPTIKQGVTSSKKNNPKILVIVFYFLHKGAHVKRDIYEELNPALEEEKMKNVFITEHIGADEMIIDLIIERAKQVEKIAN